MPLAAGDILTVAQVLGILPISRSLLYRLIDEGQIKALRVASSGSKRGRLLVPRAALEAYLAERLAPARRGATQAPTNVDVDGLLARIRDGAGT